MMKNLSWKILIILFVFTSINGWAQIELPAPSPAGKTYSKVGLTDVEISYSRPKMKGRAIFGQGDDYLLKFGEIWRTGANNGTIITFSDDVKLAGKELAAGEYMIITIPQQSEWTVIFYKDISLGGNVANYKEEEIALQAKINSSSLTEPVETLTINISDIAADNSSAAIEIAWENTSVKIPFEVSFEDKIMKDIEASTKVSPGNYLTAARYYFDSGKDAQQSLKWITMYFDSNERYQEQFWNLHLMAQIQAYAGDKKAAKATAEISLEKARSNEDGDFGYIKINEDFLASL